MGGRGGASGTESHKSDIIRSESIKREFLNAGLNSSISGIRKKAEYGTGNYDFKNASAVSAKEAEKFVMSSASNVNERNGKTLIKGSTKSGKFVFYANDSDSPEIKKLMKMRHKDQDTTIRRHDFSTGITKTTSTYEKSRKRNQKKFSDWWGGTDVKKK